jgi:hypothetical protein
MAPDFKRLGIHLLQDLHEIYRDFRPKMTKNGYNGPNKAIKD